MSIESSRAIVDGPGRVRSTASAYALAIGGLAAALLIRWLLDPLMGDTLPLVTLFGAVAAAVWVGGYRPAIVVVILGYLACAYLFIQPRGRSVSTNSDMSSGSWRISSPVRSSSGSARRHASPRICGQASSVNCCGSRCGSIGDAVITTDIDGRVTYLNAVAESLTGWTQPDAVGQPLDSVFRIVNEGTRRPGREPRNQGCCGRASSSGWRTTRC